MQSSIVIAICACSSDKLTMVTTTETEQWVEIAGYNPDAPGIATDIVVDLDAMGKTMQGFGMCFSELSWRSHDEQTLIPLSFQLPQPQNHHSSEQQCFNDYWNMSLFDGEVSTWGWQQNSLISVDYETGLYKYNYELLRDEAREPFHQTGCRLSWNKRKPRPGSCIPEPGQVNRPSHRREGRPGRKCDHHHRQEDRHRQHPRKQPQYGCDLMI